MINITRIIRSGKIIAIQISLWVIHQRIRVMSFLTTSQRAPQPQSNLRGLSLVGRATPLQGEGHQFESDRLHNLCNFCQKQFESKRLQSFCSKQCANRSRRKVKPCGLCGKDIVLRHNPIKGLYCFNCKAKGQYQDYIQRWLEGKESGNSGENISPYVRRYLFEKYDAKCQECGWSKINSTSGKIPLQVDHTDGNSTNTIPENLKLLCPNCHSLTPTFGNLNAGKGRPSRRKKIKS